MEGAVGYDMKLDITVITFVGEHMSTVTIPYIGGITSHDISTKEIIAIDTLEACLIACPIRKTIVDGKNLVSMLHVVHHGRVKLRLSDAMFLKHSIKISIVILRRYILDMHHGVSHVIVEEHIFELPLAHHL